MLIFSSSHLLDNLLANCVVCCFVSCSSGLMMGAVEYRERINKVISWLAASGISRSQPQVSQRSDTSAWQTLHDEVSIDKSREIERVLLPDLMQFKYKYMDRGQPVIVTGAMEAWPAMGVDGGSRSWENLDYIVGVAGHRTVPVEVGPNYMDTQWGQQLMTVRKFIDEFVVEAEEDAIEGHPDGEVEATVKRRRVQSSPPLLSSSSSSSPPSQPAGTGKLRRKRQVGYLAQHQLFDQVPQLRSDIAVPDYCILSDEDGDSGTPSPLPQFLALFFVCLLILFLYFFSFCWRTFLRFTLTLKYHQRIRNVSNTLKHLTTVQTSASMHGLGRGVPSPHSTTIPLTTFSRK
jgi:lysine-specific demethylase 8